MNDVSYSCVKDEGGPLGISFQERVRRDNQDERRSAHLDCRAISGSQTTPSGCGQKPWS
jgi:hypothetical protein